MKLNLFFVVIVASSLLDVGSQDIYAQGERQVQIRSVDFLAGIIEVYNFGSNPVDLTGWRFCTHDFDQDRRYSSASGLAGVTIGAKQSIFIHYENDAASNQANAFNRSDLGGSFALPLDQDAYAIQIFFPNARGTVAFGDSSLIADHMQWNFAGAEVGQTLFRSDQAVDEGLWLALNDFVLTNKATSKIDLLDESGDEFGRSAEYTMFTFAGDVNQDGQLNLLDVAPFVFIISSGLFQQEADLNKDDVVNLLDVSPFVRLLGGN